MAERHDNVRRFFAQHSEAWLRRYHCTDFDSVSYQDRMQEASRLLERHGRPRMRVLEVGCGAGVYAGLLHARGHDVFACDIAPEMAQKAREWIGPRAFVSTGEKLPLASASFDAVVALGVISYAPDPAAFLDSLVRVLRPGGVLVISSVNDRLLLRRLSGAVSRWPDRLYLWLKARLTGYRAQPSDTAAEFFRSHLNYMDARTFDRLLSRAGVQRLAGSAVDFGRLRFMDKDVTGERLAIAISRALTRLSRRLPGLQRHARMYIAALRKPPALAWEIGGTRTAKSARPAQARQDPPRRQDVDWGDGPVAGSGKPLARRRRNAGPQPRIAAVRTEA